MFISNLIWDIVHSAIKTKFFRQTNTTDTTYYSNIPYGNKPPQWKMNS